MHTAQLVCNFILPTVISACYACVTVDNYCFHARAIYHLSPCSQISFGPPSFCGLSSAFLFLISRFLSYLLSVASISSNLPLFTFFNDDNDSAIHKATLASPQPM